MYEIVKQALYRTMSPRTNCLAKHTTLVLYEYIVIWRVDSHLYAKPRHIASSSLVLV